MEPEGYNVNKSPPLFLISWANSMPATLMYYKILFKQSEHQFVYSLLNYILSNSRLCIIEASLSKFNFFTISMANDPTGRKRLW
jgi:hypothetical protein